MEDLKQQQIEILKEAVPYSEKMIGAIDKVSEELTGICYPETRGAADVIIEGLNWLLEVYNGTKDLINPDKDKVNETNVNAAVTKLSGALKTGNNKTLGEAIKEIEPFVQEFHDAANEVL